MYRFNEVGKHSFESFANAVGREMYGACVPRPISYDQYSILMTPLCERTENIARTHLLQKSSIFAKNHFSGARACTRVTRVQYGVSRIGLHSSIERNARYNVVSISKSEITVLVKLIHDPNNSRYTLRNRREFF